MDGGGNILEYLTCGFAGDIKLAEGDGTAVARKFSGYGAVFKNVDSYGDVIEPGAFSAWLADVKGGKQEWPAMLSQHGGWGMSAEDLTPVGAWLDFYEDGKGLGVEGELADTQRGGDLYKLMKMKPRPAIKGLSIGYYAREFEMGSKPDEPRRRLKRIDVVEVSLVTFPANAKAKVSAVKSIEAIATLGHAEDFLRAKGLSKTEAVALIARIKSARPGDPVGEKGGPGDPAAMAEIAESLRRNAAIAAS